MNDTRLSIFLEKPADDISEDQLRYHGPAAQSYPEFGVAFAYVGTTAIGGVMMELFQT